MDNVITLFLVLTAVGMLLVLLFLWRLRSAWPKSNADAFCRERLQLPRRRHSRRWVWPHLRLRWPDR